MCLWQVEVPDQWLCLRHRPLPHQESSLCALDLHPAPVYREASFFFMADLHWSQVLDLVEM